VRRAATLLLLLLAVPAAAEERPIWLAVGPEPLLEAIAPLAEHRRLEGLEPILSSRPAAEAIRAAPRPPAYLLLVGDDEPGQEAAPWYHAAPRRELYRWARRQDETFAADTLLGDLDGDLVPDIPVGRLPCRSPQEVAAAVAKIRLREDRPPTTEDLALPVWSCATLFGDQMDALSTGLVLVNLRRHAPEWVRPWVLTSIPRRPFCGVPAEQPRLFSERLRRGGQIAAIVAHADRTGVLAMREKGRRVVYTARTATETFAKGPPGPPLFVIACLAGDFTAPKPCFAEELLAMPGGPVAVVAATTESHPLTNYYSSVELLRALGDRHDRLGDLWLAAQRSALEQLDPLVDMALRNVEGSLEPSLDVERLQRDQPLMYALLGDPATRLRAPRSLTVTMRPAADGWRYVVEPPHGAMRLVVQLRPHRWPPVVPSREEPAPDVARRRLEEANATFEFETVAKRVPGEAWTGTVKGRGLLRFVVRTPDAIHVATVRLRAR
jgi:hypothetical protein